jgi:NTE family protein
METGYRRTLELMDSIKARVPREAPLEEVTARRKAFRQSLPPLVFRDIYISGVSDAQKAYIEAQLHRDINGDFSMEAFKRAYFKMLTYSKIKEIIPHAVYNRREKKFDLHLEVTMSDEIIIGFGGNVSSHQANQLYLGLAYQNISTFAADLNADFQVGNSFDGVSLNGRFYLPASFPAYLSVQGVFSHRKYLESQSLFYEDIVPSIIRQRELFLNARFGFPILNRAKVEAGSSFGSLNDYYFQTANLPLPGARFDRSSYNLFRTYVAAEHNTMDYKQYPTSGRRQYLAVSFITGRENYRPSPSSMRAPSADTHAWLQLKGRWNHHHVFSPHFNLGILSELVYSNKPLLANYTSTILQAPAFTPTPHSEIVFNEAFRANQYVATGLSPIFKISRIAHVRADLFAFVPFRPIRKRSRQTGDTNDYGTPYYGGFMDAFEFMGETAFVVQLPFVTISVYGTGYSSPRKNFNFGLNIGYLLFNRRMLD